MDCYSHHGTSGFTYSFGNRPLYGNKDGKSVSCYGTKTSKVEARRNIIENDARYLEYRCAVALDHGITKISKIFPEISLLLCPIVNAAFDTQCKEGFELL